MPRPLVFGNGRLLVQLDDKGRIRDFFWPQVGIRNHVGGHVHHLGVGVDGRFSWTESSDWIVSQEYLKDSMVGVTRFHSTALGLEIEARDEVVADTFHRALTIKNLSSVERQVELFFSQDFRIAESEIGDTALYHPRLNAMVHFKWNYYFICGGRSELGGIHQKTVGLRGIGGLQGTWRDAEDGQLNGKPIEQGAVDSTFSVLVKCPPTGEARAEYRITCTHEMPFLGCRLPEPGADSSAKAAVLDLSPLPPDVQALAKRSIDIILTQIDSGGGILAANDSDIMRSNRANYSYVWPRDGALVAAVLDRVRLHDVARQYHEFTIPLISDRQPFFLQKYNVDGTLGATWHPWVFDGRPSIPFQQDETALTLWSVWRHVQATGDYEWLSRYYKTFVKPMTSFLTIFPTMSYDLWEERRGLHTFTVATVVAGLIAAAEMAVKCGDESSQASLGVASQAKAQLLNLHVDPQTGAFLRGDESLPGLSTRWDRTTDASLLLVGRFAGLAPDHPVVMATNKRVEEELWVHSAIGGLARYSGDYYGRVIDAYPGNPWVITTMWLAQEKIRAARSLSDLDRPLELLQWAVERSGTTGVLGEQFHPDTGEVVTVSPLTWSHSEFIATCLDWVEKHRDLV